MILLLAFAFIAGIVTILSPCILPLLPIILSSSVGDKKSRLRPWGIVSGFILSFTFFTLFLASLVKLFGISADLLRTASVVIIAGFGLSLIFHYFPDFSRLAPKNQNRPGYWGGVAIGLSLGLLWTPCVGPILASVIALAATGAVNSQAVLITLAYSTGTAIPMFIVMSGGRKWLHQFPQKIFGLIMILTAAGIYFNLDRNFQTFILAKFPSYGANLTKFETKAPTLEQVRSNAGKTAPEIIPGGVWFNSAPLTIQSLRGKVALIDFWTYSCINCQRTFPYLKTWWAKYQDKGLVIIGVHSPEFEFEKNPDNLKKAIADFGLTYPIVQDNNFATWNAYQNQYWPAKYLIDKDGKIRYTHFGEGNYDEIERQIQALLAEAGATDLPQNINNPTYQIDAATPETYLGSKRASPNDYLTLNGDWQVQPEYAQANPGAGLVLHFDAKQVFLVMNPVGRAAKVGVILDGQILGVVTVDSDKLYQLVNLAQPGRHTLELRFDDGNIQTYAFTFG